MKNIILSIISLALVVACSNSEDSAKQAILNTLKDPDSAKFIKITMRSTGDNEYACITLRAKNSFGGYEGNKVKLLHRKNSKGWDVESFKYDHEDCVGVLESTIKKVEEYYDK